MVKELEQSTSVVVDNSNQIQAIDLLQQTIAIAATFTAESIADSLAFWMRELNIVSDNSIEFAPYNQIFQQLLDPTSLLNSNKSGFNIILVRLEDWGKYRNNERKTVANNSSAHSQITQTAQEFIQVLKAAIASTKTPYLVCLCPNSPNTIADLELNDIYNQIEAQVLAELAGISNIYLISSNELKNTYPVEAYYDPQGDKLGHIPFTPLFFAAIGTAIARKIYVVQSAPPKVIVLDCDRTLWEGICGEDGAMGIEIDPPRKILQELMVEQHDAGMLLCVCSKNNEQDVVEVFERRLDMPLKRDNFVSWRVNWEAKSENIKSLAQELNLGLDSFIFIDDNPVECAEVQANCPEVLTLLLPTKIEEIPRFLRHIWAFDRLKVTVEDQQRTALYKQNIQRDLLLKQSPTLENFLDGLGLDIKISSPSTQQIARVAQLTHRTNQFNLTTIRRSEQEIAQLCQFGELECLIVEVSDRFGDYGLVGVILFSTDSNIFNIDTFLLSCRVLGRGVEHRMLARLGEIAFERGQTQVNLPYIPSAKNQPALNFLNAIAIDFKQETELGLSFQLPVEYAKSITYNPQTNYLASAAPETKLTPAPPATARRFTRLHWIATELYSATQVFKQIELQKRQRPELSQHFVAPRNEIEQQLVQIWTQVLRIENIGIQDNFFALGGTSVIAVQIFAQIENIFAKTLPLATLLQAGTIEQLASVIQQKELSPPWSSPIVIQPGNSAKTPLFCIHAIGGGALYYRNLAKYLDPDQPVYGIEARGLDGKQLPLTRIEDMAADYIQQIYTIQPHGSYLLAGSSMGGLLAFEIARQLQVQGQKIALLALFDTISPIYNQFSLRNQISKHFEQGFYFTLARIQDRARLLAPRCLKSQTENAPSSDRTYSNFRIKVEAANKQALKAYLPQPYPLQVTLFRAINQPVGASWYTDAQLGWRKLATQGVEVHDVPGDHLSLMAKPDVQVLAAKFKLCLEKVQSNLIA